VKILVKKVQNKIFIENFQNKFFQKIDFYLKGQKSKFFEKFFHSSGCLRAIQLGKFSKKH
jgi:hypothetical protein